jgi:hypothetical protein
MNNKTRAKKANHHLKGLESSSQTIQEFSLSLPMTVSGLDSSGKEFKESSVLSTISSERATFPLKTDVERHSPLKLVIPLPPRLADGQPLSLILKGKVRTIEAAVEKEVRIIELQLDSRYFIGTEET